MLQGSVDPGETTTLHDPSEPADEGLSSSGVVLLRRLLAPSKALTHLAGSYFLLVVGFVVEYSILHESLVSVVPFSRGGPAWMFLAALIHLMILTPLFMHQFLIFRNFTLQAGTTGAKSSVGSEPARREERRVRFLRVAKAGIEVLIFLTFGVITGEAGYLYALAYTHASQLRIFLWLQYWIGTHDLGIALKVLFVIGALALCILVFLWDLAVLGISRLDEGSAERELFSGSIWWYFAVMDVLSMSLWLTIWTLVSPIGTGNIDFKILVLVFFALLYSAVTIGRLVRAARRLLDVTEARSEAIAV